MEEKRKQWKDETSARGGDEGVERKAGGAGRGSTSTGAVAPGLGTEETTPKGDLDHPGGMTRPLGELSEESEEEPASEG